jgi:hypothetical protein
MIVPDLPIERVLKQARIDVARATNGRQIPWESSSLLGEFYFNPAKASELVETSELSSPADNQKKTIAATPKSKEKIKWSDSRYKFAIFPWKQDIFYRARRGYFYDIYFDALKNSLKSYNNIVLKYSYYEHDEFGNEIEIIKDLFSEGGGKVWTKKSYFSSPSPNLDEIIKIAAKINADLVLLYYAKLDGDSDIGFNSLYLVDTKKKLLIMKKYEGYLNTDLFESMMNKLLDEYFRKSEAG